MKHNLSLLTGALFIAASAGVNAQTTAVTDPVGYITINVAGTASQYTYSAIAPTLVNKVEFSGVVSAISADGRTLTVSGLTGTFTSGYWIEVTNGAGEGAWTNVTGNSPTTITTVDSMTPFITAGTSTVKLRQHVTIAQFFGATNTAGLQAGADPGLADEIIFLGDRGVASQNITVFYDGTGWFDGNFGAAENMAIEPGQGLLIGRRATTNTSFVQVGHVKTGKSMNSGLAGPVAGDFGENVMGIRSAVGVKLKDSRLHTGVDATGVHAGDDPGLADEVIQFVGGAPVTYFNDGTWNGTGPDTSWFDGNFAPAGETVLAEGTALYILRKNGGDFVWTSPAVSINTTP